MRPLLAATIMAALGLSQLAAATPSKFHLTFDRPKKVGSRFELTGTYRSTNYYRADQDGVSLGDNDEYLEANYDVIEKVTKIDDNGDPQELRIFFRSLSTRNDSGGTYADASCVGVPIDVVVWPDVSITREDGQDFVPDEKKVVAGLFRKTDPDAPTDDQVLAPDHDVSIGDSWHPTSDEMSRYLQAQGLLIPDNSAVISLKLADHRKVGGIDCLIVDFSLDCPNIDGDTSLPADFRAIHGSSKGSSEYDLPIDPALPMMSYRNDTSATFNASVDKDGSTINVNGQQSQASTEEFVKAL